jgi:hypothetical protein
MAMSGSCRRQSAERYRTVATRPKYKVTAVPQQHHLKFEPRKIFAWRCQKAVTKQSGIEWNQCNPAELDCRSQPSLVIKHHAP